MIRSFCDWKVMYKELIFLTYVDHHPHMLSGSIIDEFKWQVDTDSTHQYPRTEYESRNVFVQLVEYDRLQKLRMQG